MYSPWNGIEKLVAKAASLGRGEDTWVSIFLGAEHAGQAEDLIAALNARGVSYFGAIFPGLINGESWSGDGALLNRWRMAAKPRFANLDDGEVEWDAPLPSLDRARSGRPTVLILVDFWSRQTTRLLDELFDKYGNTVNYVGAGCGLGQRRHTPCILHSTGNHEKAAVVAFLDHDAKLELRHGWGRISEALVATRTEANVIQEFNWEPAVEVYKSVVGDNVATSLNDTYRPEAKRYPFGIFRENEEDIVRDPMAITDSGGLLCLSDVAENSVMHVLHGKTEDLVKAAGEVSRECFAQPPVGSSDSEQSLIFDCFSRALLLEEEIAAELGAISAAMKAAGSNTPPCGVLALGEIASTGERLPQYHNKTVVVARVFD